jgi:hypothetical protein
MTRPQLLIKIKHRIEGQIKIQINAPLFLAWKIHKRDIDMNWPATLTLTDAVDLAFYVACKTHKTKYENKEQWIAGIYGFEGKYQKGLLA